MSNMVEAIYAAETALAGSMIATATRPGLFNTLRVDFDFDRIEDPSAKVILKAARIIANTPEWSGAIPTPENILAVIVNDGLSGRTLDTAETLSQFRVEAMQKILDCAQFGYDSPEAVNSSAATVRDHIALKNLMRYAQNAQGMAASSAFGAVDLFYEMSHELQMAQPNSIVAEVYTLSDLRSIARQMIERQKSLLGQKLMTFPPEFGLDDHIPYILPGLMYAITGLKGHGKSSLLLMIADWLALCGFKVLYFHAEDDIERQFVREARRLTGASPREIMAGDVRGRGASTIKMLAERHKNSGGEVIFSHCMNQPVSYITMITNSFKPDVIIVDYLQKLNIVPQLKTAGGIRHEALALATEELKQLAEGYQHQCAVILGSQEAERDGEREYRKGTAGSRQIEWKSQVVVEIERLRLTEKDQPEIVNGIQIAGPGDLSGFGSLIIGKNNDGSTGEVRGVFNGHKQQFTSLSFAKWRREHPGEPYRPSKLEVPSQDYLEAWDAKTKAWDDLDLHMEHPKMRKKDASKPKSTDLGPKNSDDFEPEVVNDIPF